VGEVTGVDELAAFVRQQLDDDERVARRAAETQGATWRGGPSMVEGGPHTVRRQDTKELVVLTRQDRPAPDAAVDHIARWDPARVLAEVEARRRILAEHKPMDGVGDRIVGCHTCSWRDDWDELHVEHPCPTLRLLAQPYAGRDGWREEWRA
jgi:hypothetical protein